MKVYQVAVGPMQNFSYIVEDESTQEVIIIDPSWDLEKLTKLSTNKILIPNISLILTGMMTIQEEMRIWQKNSA